jgi:DNA-binding transcriptional LysR family regulator
MHDLDTRLLRSFLAVATARSFSRAAARLGCSQATMSQRIRQLEGALGVTLLQRDYHDVALTPAGAEMMGRARAVVDAHDGLLGVARRGQIAGAVRLGIAEDYVLPMLPQLLRTLRQRLPAVELTVVTGLSRDLGAQVEARALDMAVVTLAHDPGPAALLAERALLWVGAPDAPAQPEGERPMAFFPEGCVFRAEAERRLTETATPYRVALVSASGQVIQAAVAAGLAFSVMAEGTLPPDLRALPPGHGLPDLPPTRIQIVERTHGQSPAMREVRAIVAEVW